MFVGSGSIKRDIAWFRRHAEGFDVRLEDTTEDYAVLCLMGPQARRIAVESGAPEIVDIGYFKHACVHIAGCEVRAARISYVGEAGWEMTCRSENASKIYAAFVSKGAKPAGLFAQTSMRIEKGFCAMGHELDADVTPVEAGLLPMTRTGGGFLGYEALCARKQEGAKRKVISLLFEDAHAVPLGHEPVYLDGDIIGETSSCAFGYRIGAPVALGYGDAQMDAGARVEVDIAREMFAARIMQGALFDPDGSLMRNNE